MTAPELLAAPPATAPSFTLRLCRSIGPYAAGVLGLALAYYCAAKLGQALHYTASVSAIWPPAGVGIAALYVWGLRWWPGILIAELFINAEFVGGSMPLPLVSLLGQQSGNLAEVVVGALLLRRLLGRDAALDRAQHVGGIVTAAVAATGLSAAVGTLSMLAGDVISTSQSATFLRTWWLGDFAGALVVVPAALVWIRHGAAAWARIRSWDGGLLILAVALLAATAISTSEPVTYVVFPALVWIAFRLGPPGATVAVAIASGAVVAITAHHVGAFSKQPIDHRTLSTQVYIVVMALTTLFVTAVVTERERAARELAEATRREGDLALEERQRIARDLHDSVSQALFSTVLETRTAQRALNLEPGRSGELAPHLSAIADLTRQVQSEMRAMIFELDRDPVSDGLGAALVAHAAEVRRATGLAVDVCVDQERLGVGRRTETELFGIAREAMANVVKHAHATTISVTCAARPSSVVLEVVDDGRGFAPNDYHRGRFGLESMRGRAASVGGRLHVASHLGGPTVVRVEVPLRQGGTDRG